MVSRLQVKATQIGRILTTLERSYDSTPMASPISQQPPPMKKPHLRIDPIPPFNANRIRKSPSSLANTANAQLATEAIKVEEEGTTSTNSTGREEKPIETAQPAEGV